MKIILLRYYAFGFILLLTSQVKAQEVSINLSLEEALQQAQSQSWEMKIKEAEIQSSQARYQKTNAAYLPQVELSNTVVHTTNPLQSFGIKLMQENVEQADFEPTTLNDPAGITNFNTRLEVRQPIVNIDAWHGRKAAAAQWKAAQFTATRTAAMIQFEIKKAYFALKLAYEYEKVLQKAMETAQANLKLTQDNLAQGYVKEADVMSVELRILEVDKQLIEAENGIRNASDYLHYFLQSDPSMLIIPTDEFNTSPNVTLLAASEVSESRSDLQAMQLGVEASQHMLQAQKSQWLPRINAFGYYELNDASFLGTEGENYLLGAQLSWTLFNGGQHYTGVRKAKADLSKMELSYQQQHKQANLELRKAKREAFLGKEKLTISEKAILNARETQRIRNNRYKQGLERTTDVLQAETELAQTELSHLQNLYQYHVALFQLSYLLEN